MAIGSFVSICVRSNMRLITKTRHRVFWWCGFLYINKRSASTRMELTYINTLPDTSPVSRSLLLSNVFYANI